MRDDEDYVVSGTQTNLFVLQGKELVTPDLSHAGVAGVIRGLVLESAGDFALRPRVGLLGIDDLKQADALFVTNSVMGLCPVERFEERRYDPNGIPAGLLSVVEASYRTEA